MFVVASLSGETRGGGEEEIHMSRHFVLDFFFFFFPSLLIFSLCFRISRTNV